MSRGAGPALIGRGPRRRAWLGLLTVLGLAERGFFIPYRYADRVPSAGDRIPYPAAEALFETRHGQFREVLAWVDELAEDLLRIGSDPAPAPRWTQGWFPRLDAAVAYTLARRLEPSRIVEVGAGHSTRFLLRAVDDGGLATELTVIDPEPRAGLPPGRCALHLQSLQDVGPAPFAALAAGDMVMVDSSHILMPGSDVDYLLGRVFPALPSGIHVHLHDVFLPDDYPADWDWRGYNEQLGILPLICGGGWDVTFASHYVVTRMSALVAGSVLAKLPLMAGAYESGLWLRKR